MSDSNLVFHSGSCHCGAVKWQCEGPKILKAITCNCSICKKKQNHHFIVSKECFRLLEGKQFLTTYQFNQKLAQHSFCQICGVQSFYVPRSNPNDVAIMPHCIDSDTVEKIEWTTFDGENWEETMKHQAPKAFSLKQTK